MLAMEKGRTLGDGTASVAGHFLEQTLRSVCLSRQRVDGYWVESMTLLVNCGNARTRNGFINTGLQRRFGAYPEFWNSDDSCPDTLERGLHGSS